VAEPETSQPAAQSDRAAKKPRQGSGPGGYSWKAIALAALGIYALLLIIQNSKPVSVSFVVFSERTRVIYLVVLCMALGALITWLVPRMRHGRKDRRRSSEGGTAAKSGQGEGGTEGFNWKAIILAGLAIYVLLLIILNRKTVSLDFVFFNQETRVIFLILLSLALGGVITWLAPRILRRRREMSPAPASPVRDDPPALEADVTSAGAPD
jgi:uncharacterized integral membrane protein